MTGREKVQSGKMPKQMTILHELDLLAVTSLHGLISLVHEHVNPSQPVDSTPSDNVVVGEKDESSKITEVNLFNLKDEPVANVLWSLQPLPLQHVLLTMAHNFPRTLEALILHALSPVGAEVLT